MALPRQKIQVAWQGLDTKTSPYLTVPGTFSDLQNMRFDRSGELVMRRGTERMSMNSTRDSAGNRFTLSYPRSIAATDTDLILEETGANNGYYSWVAADSGWKRAGHNSRGLVKVSPKAQCTRGSASALTSPQLFYGAMAIANGYEVYVRRDEAGLVYDIIDQSTGAYLLKGAEIPLVPGSGFGSRDYAWAPKVVATGASGTTFTKVWIVHRVEDVELGIWVLDMTNPTAALTNVAVGFTSTDVIRDFDIEAYSSGGTNYDQVLVALSEYSSPYDILYGGILSHSTGTWAVALTSTLLVPGQVDTLTWQQNSAYGISGTVSAPKIFCYESTTNNIVEYIPTVATMLFLTRNIVDAGYAAGTREFVAYLQSRGGSTYEQIIYTSTAAPTVLRRSYRVNTGAWTNGDWIHHARIASKQWVYDSLNDSICVMLAHVPMDLGSSYPQPACSQSRLIAIEAGYSGTLASARLIAACFHGEADFWSSPAKVWKTSLGWAFPVLKNTSFIVDSAAAPVGWPTVCKFEFDSTTSPGPIAAFKNVAIIPGGVTRYFDGSTVFEHGFALYPEGPYLSDAGAASGSTTGGTYSICLVFSWTDSKGRLHRSAPSVAKSISLAAGHAADLRIQTLPFSEKASQIQIEVYSTTGSATDYHRIDCVLNTTTAGYVTYRMAAADATILTGELLYTDAGRVENDSAPPSYGVVQWNGRAVLWGCEDKQVIWIGKELDDTLAPSLSANFVVPVIDDQGEIIDVCPFNDNLVIAKTNSLYVLQGKGPDESGAGMWANAERISSHHGVPAPKTMVKTDAGVFFKSSAGYFLLDTSLAPRYIGSPVASYESMAVACSILDPVRSLIYWHHSGASQKTALVYDLVFGQWYYDVFTDVGPETPYNACYFSGAKYVSAGATVVKDTSTYYEATAAGTKKYYTPYFALNAIRTAGIDGYKRIYEIHLIADYVSSHVVTATLTSTTDTGDQLEVFTKTMSAADERLVIKPKYQKCSAFTLGFSFTGATANPAKISAIVADIGLKNTLHKRATASRMTPT